MNPLPLAVAWLVLAGPVAPATTETAARFTVVVNAANPEKSADPETLTEIFLKQKKKWANGEAIVPVDQSVVSAVRQTFTTVVFGQQASAIQSYWQGEVAAGRDVPPPVRTSDDEVVAFVAANAGAIGYVSSAAKLPRTVRGFRVER
jgi:ABC-type phosphate transport system substrate-binding protein